MNAITEMKMAVALCTSCMALSSMGEESPLVLFTAISGRPGAAEAREIVERGLDAGFSQWMLYPRSGLEYDYMGEEWLAFVGDFLKLAQEKGGHVWLYDEFNWPSGSCRGRVTRENPAWTYSEMGVRRLADGSFSWEVKRNDQTSMYERYFDVNTYEPAAMRRFMELTHEVYAARFGEYMKDGTIRGMFTDEPGHPSRMKWGDPQPVATFRYWSELEDQYRETTGRDFRGDVERTLSHPGATESGAVFETYTELKGRQFKRSYFKPIAEWCRAHGIDFCGHMICEGEPMTSTTYNGLPLELVRQLTLPGIDKIRADIKPTDEWLTYSQGQYGIEHCSEADDALTAHGGIELFALGPSDLTLPQMVQRIWIAALYGMDTYYLALWHVSAVTFAEKGGYAMFVSPTQPWFNHCSDLHAEAKEAARQSRKRFVRKVGVRYPQRLYGSLALRKVRWPKHPHLIPLICEFAWNQVSFELLQEDEPSALEYVFDCRIGGEFFEEKSGRTFDSPSAVRAWLEKEDKDAWRVVDESGETVAGVLTRRYADGTFVALNMTDRDYPELTLVRGCAEPRRISLPPGGRARDVAPAFARSVLSPDWSVAFDRPALRRIWFDTNGVARLSMEKPVPDARWVVCDMPHGGVRVRVDGRPVAAVQPASSLPYAYAGLYRSTEPFVLAAGEHELRLEGRADDSVFLPTVWLERPADVSTLNSFAGCISYAAEVDVPKRCDLRLCVEADGLVAEVFLDGVSLGERGVGPFEWKIPESKMGDRHSLEIRLHTSVRPIFGSESAPGVRLKDPLWCPTTWNVAPRGLVRAEWRWLERLKF